MRFIHFVDNTYIVHILYSSQSLSSTSVMGGSNHALAAKVSHAL